jgi:Na+-transporting NADH:ubiquinone oxidoreductase subunit NqrF
MIVLCIGVDKYDAADDDDDYDKYSTYDNDYDKYSTYKYFSLSVLSTLSMYTLIFHPISLSIHI